MDKFYGEKTGKKRWKMAGQNEKDIASMTLKRWNGPINELCNEEQMKGAVREILEEIRNSKTPHSAILGFDSKKAV